MTEGDRQRRRRGIALEPLPEGGEIVRFDDGVRVERRDDRPLQKLRLLRGDDRVHAEFTRLADAAGEVGRVDPEEIAAGGGGLGTKTAEQFRRRLPDPFPGVVRVVDHHQHRLVLRREQRGQRSADLLQFVAGGNHRDGPERGSQPARFDRQQPAFPQILLPVALFQGFSRKKRTTGPHQPLALRCRIPAFHRLIRNAAANRISPQKITPMPRIPE
ncbi:hypothetical protein SDC9_176280 [bioreactor metagenome]|uniref:Uncharacterized protein n=1 Tax=bioreactor metagenome TaxID=1076179 RepID=A0A645GQ86_9ZZZZ